MARKQKKPAQNRGKPNQSAPRHTAEYQSSRRTGSANHNRSQHEKSRDQHTASHTNSFRPKYADSVFLYGRNSVKAALANSNRECIRLFATERALEALDSNDVDRVAVLPLSGPEMFSGIIPHDAPHQGLVLEARPLPGCALEDLHPIEGKKNIILMLDQVTDPQNVGACLRSATAFGARAIITQDRNSPAESGALARASAGGLEMTPWVRVANLAQTIESLKELGYWHVGLDGHTDQSLKQTSLGENIVIIMGSEGKGLRPLVQKNCDVIAKIPMSGRMESLNVSNAAAIALYELS